MGSAIAVAAGIGVAVAVQVAVLARASGAIHPLAMSLALQAGGLMVGALWAVNQGAWTGVLEAAVQWWWIPLGALGWGIVAALGFSASRAGVGTTLAVVVTAQLLVGLGLDRTIDHVQITGRQYVGVTLLVAGVALVSVRG